MDEGKGTGKFVEKLAKMKRMKLILTIGVPVVIGLFFAMVLIIVIVAKWEWLLSVFSSSSTVGVQTIYDDTYLMDQVNSSMENWSDEEKFVFTEMQRQHDIWVNDYVDYQTKPEVVINYPSNELDLVKFVVPIQHRGAANITAYGYDYSETNKTIGEDGTNLNDYDGEVTVYNHDTRDFYVQAGEKLGSTFFLFPGLRQMMGNSISANVTYDIIHPAYAPCVGIPGYYCITNLDSILSNWSDLGTMYMNGESAYELYFDMYPKLGPLASANYFVGAINYGLENCKLNKPEDDNDWNYLNICNDYELIYSENNGYVKDYNTYYNVALLSDSLNEAFSKRLDGGLAELPIYEYDENGQVSDNSTNIKRIIPEKELIRETERWFITVNVRRDNDWNLYEKYLKDIYIPHLYINCENCNHEKTVDGVLSEMSLLEKTYRYYNREEYNGGFGSYGVGSSGTVLPANGTSANLPSVFNSQLVNPINGAPSQTSCFGYYDALPGTRYYCYVHRGVDLVGGSQILSPADGVVKYCNVQHNSWGPYLEIEHTLKDENGAEVKIISYYMHWLNASGNLSCAGLAAGTNVTKGQHIATVSNQAGTHSVGTHLHFGLKSMDGTLYNPESYLYSLGVSTRPDQGTANCDEVRRICNAYCAQNHCTTA